MTEYENRVTEITVLPKGEPLYCEYATKVSIDDEASGEFVVVTQNAPLQSDETGIAIEKAYWPALRDAIERLLADCRGAEDQNAPPTARSA